MGERGGTSRAARFLWTTRDESGRILQILDAPSSAKSSLAKTGRGGGAARAGGRGGVAPRARLVAPDARRLLGDGASGADGDERIGAGRGGGSGSGNGPDRRHANILIMSGGKAHVPDALVADFRAAIAWDIEQKMRISMCEVEPSLDTVRRLVYDLDHKRYDRFVSLAEIARIVKLLHGVLCLFFPSGHRLGGYLLQREHVVVHKNGRRVYTSGQHVAWCSVLLDGHKCQRVWASSAYVLQQQLQKMLANYVHGSELLDSQNFVKGLRKPYMVKFAPCGSCKDGVERESCFRCHGSGKFDLSRACVPTHEIMSHDGSLRLLTPDERRETLKLLGLCSTRVVGAVERSDYTVHESQPEFQAMVDGTFGGGASTTGAETPRQLERVRQQLRDEFDAAEEEQAIADHDRRLNSSGGGGGSGGGGNGGSQTGTGGGDGAAEPNVTDEAAADDEATAAAKRTGLVPGYTTSVDDAEEGGIDESGGDGVGVGVGEHGGGGGGGGSGGDGQEEQGVQGNSGNDGDGGDGDETATDHSERKPRKISESSDGARKPPPPAKNNKRPGAASGRKTGGDGDDDECCESPQKRVRTSEAQRGGGSAGGVGDGREMKRRGGPATSSTSSSLSSSSSASADERTSTPQAFPQARGTGRQVHAPLPAGAKKDPESWIRYGPETPQYAAIEHFIRTRLADEYADAQMASLSSTQTGTTWTMHTLSRYCQNYQDTHSGRTVYFIFSVGTRMCYQRCLCHHKTTENRVAGVFCKQYKSPGTPLTRDLATLLFGQRGMVRLERERRQRETNRRYESELDGLVESPGDQVRARLAAVNNGVIPRQRVMSLTVLDEDDADGDQDGDTYGTDAVLYDDADLDGLGDSGPQGSGRNGGSRRGGRSGRGSGGDGSRRK